LSDKKFTGLSIDIGDTSFGRLAINSGKKDGRVVLYNDHSILKLNTLDLIETRISQDPK
jgi:hypothetical protein